MKIERNNDVMNINEQIEFFNENNPIILKEQSEQGESIYFWDKSMESRT